MRRSIPASRPWIDGRSTPGAHERGHMVRRATLGLIFLAIIVCVWAGVSSPQVVTSGFCGVPAVHTFAGGSTTLSVPTTAGGTGLTIPTAPTSGGRIVGAYVLASSVAVNYSTDTSTAPSSTGPMGPFVNNGTATTPPGLTICGSDMTNIKFISTGSGTSSAVLGVTFFAPGG